MNTPIAIDADPIVVDLVLATAITVGVWALLLAVVAVFEDKRDKVLDALAFLGEGSRVVLICLALLAAYGLVTVLVKGDLPPPPPGLPQQTVASEVTPKTYSFPTAARMSVSTNLVDWAALPTWDTNVYGNVVGYDRRSNAVLFLKHER